MKPLEANQINLRRQAVDPATLLAAAEIVEAIRTRGEQALIEYATRFGDMTEGDSLYAHPEDLEAAFRSLSPDHQAVLVRTAERIRNFAKAQLESIQPIEVDVECGKAGQEIAPVEIAGCYAPGGRYPLPSSVLMTAVTARTARVKDVWVASPKPTAITLAAAHVAGVDGLLKAGGAQAIACLAYGCGPVPPCDAVVGPGNRWVTAAKQLIAGHVAIDMLAGPSELVVLAAPDADPNLIVVDMLAQAEHDPDASAYLVTWSPQLIEACSRLMPQLDERFGPVTSIFVENEAEGVEVCNRIAPEHLQLSGSVSMKPTQYGALFAGDSACEVFGDYGAGPNHTLPTGGTARSFAGLSVFTFLRIRTWMRGDRLQPQLRNDTVQLAEWEGLEWHARAAAARRAD